jgi:hypothetical protein
MSEIAKLMERLSRCVGGKLAEDIAETIKEMGGKITDYEVETVSLKTQIEALNEEIVRLKGEIGYGKPDNSEVEYVKEREVRA